MEISCGANDEIMVITHTAAATIKSKRWRGSGNKSCSFSALLDVGKLKISLSHFHRDISTVVVVLELGEAGAEESEGEGGVLEDTGWSLLLL